MRNSSLIRQRTTKKVTKVDMSDSILKTGNMREILRQGDMSANELMKSFILCTEVRTKLEADSNKKRRISFKRSISNLANDSSTNFF